MIVYDNVDIRSIADVKIEDIRVGPVEINPVTRARAVAPGAEFVRTRYGTRTVSVTFAVLTDDIEARQAQIGAISEWAKSDKEYRLELPGFPDRYVIAMCTAKPEPSTRQWWETKLRLVFTCISDPFWISAQVKSAACGTAFRVLGDAPPLMQIKRTLSAAATNQAYSLDGRTMTFSTIPKGNMVIDLNNQTARVGTASIIQYYNINSQFLQPRTGQMTISGTGTVVYRERWQ